MKQCCDLYSNLHYMLKHLTRKSIKLHHENLKEIGLKSNTNFHVLPTYIFFFVFLCLYSNNNIYIVKLRYIKYMIPQCCSRKLNYMDLHEFFFFLGNKMNILQKAKHEKL